jgi:hypothetical protein
MRPACSRLIASAVRPAIGTRAFVNAREIVSDRMADRIKATPPLRKEPGT